MPSPYECPRHRVELVARVLTMKDCRAKLGYRRVRYFACPVAGCDFKRPNKWDKRKCYDKNS